MVDKEQNYSLKEDIEDNTVQEIESNRLNNNRRNSYTNIFTKLKNMSRKKKIYLGVTTGILCSCIMYVYHDYNKINNAINNMNIKFNEL